MTGLPKSVVIAEEVMEVRAMASAERPFVFSTWMEWTRRRAPTSRPVFDKFYPALVDTLLDSAQTVVLTKAGGDTVHAWACGQSPNVLHFAYVPHALRECGLGRAVIEGALGGYPRTIYVTASPLSRHNHHRFTYNPYLIMRSC